MLLAPTAPPPGTRWAAPTLAFAPRWDTAAPSLSLPPAAPYRRTAVSNRAFLPPHSRPALSPATVTHRVGRMMCFAAFLAASPWTPLGVRLPAPHRGDLDCEWLGNTDAVVLIRLTCPGSRSRLSEDTTLGRNSACLAARGSALPSPPPGIAGWFGREWSRARRVVCCLVLCPSQLQGLAHLASLCPLPRLHPLPAGPL